MLTPSLDNKAYQDQKKIFKQNKKGLIERDVVFIDVVDFNFVSFDGQKQPHIPTKHFYKAYDAPSDAFTVILIGQDGDEKWRQAEPVTVNDLYGIIDAMPMRQREINKMGK